MVISLFALLSWQIVFSETETEPYYCEPRVFYGHEIIPYFNPKIKRLRIYKLGQVHLAGMAVGHSKTKNIKKFSSLIFNVEEMDNFCTWYFNKGNQKAKNSFVHRYVKNPKSLKPQTAAKKYMERLENIFFNDPVNFLQCAETYGYIGSGCNGQKHRGPTVFGMLLSFTGCTPENASEIVNTIWGLNGIKKNIRLSIIKAAHEFGKIHKNERDHLQNLFLNSSRVH